MPHPSDSVSRPRPTWHRGAGVNQDALDAARGIARYAPSARIRESSGLAGEVAARDKIFELYGREVHELNVPRRRWANRAPVLDLLFEHPDGLILVEAKANDSPFGMSNQKVWVDEGQGFKRKVTPGSRSVLEQLTPAWFEERLIELRTQHGQAGIELAERLESAWTDGKLRIVSARAPRITPRGSIAAHGTTEVVEIVDRTREWNTYRGVAHARPPMPRPHPPGGAGATTALVRAVSPHPTNVERGLETAKKAVVPHVEPHLPRVHVGELEHAGKAGVKALEAGFKARKLLVGVKLWRAARTVGKVVALCFVPLTALDVVIEVALALWDRQREKEARKAREKQRALEAVLKEGQSWLATAMGKKPPKTIAELIDRNIASNVKVQDQFMRDWMASESFNGFQYALVTATLRVETFRDLRGEDDEDLTTYTVESRDVQATTRASDFVVEDAGDEQEVEKSEADVRRVLSEKGAGGGLMRKIVKRKRLAYTIVPPLLTPFDVVITKMNNLFVDLVQFTAYFTGAGTEIFTRPFSFDYRYPEWQTQFEVLPDFGQAPLNGQVCEYCLSYLYYSAKLLSRHPLEQQDIEGNLEDPRRGWQRRFWLLMSLLEGSHTAHGKNFAFFTGQVKRVVRGNGAKDPDVAAAVEELYAGARSIWYDLQRIEKHLEDPEYFYYGPKYSPPRG